MSKGSTTTITEIPGYVAGHWTIDPVHSDVTFTVRHLMVGKVRGRFASFEGTIELAEDPLASSVNATIDVASVDTRDPQRDGHLRSPDFLDAERYPAMSYRSTSVQASGDGYALDGELTLHGVTRPVQLELEVNGFSVHPQMGTRAGFSATAEISRKDFGIDLNMPFEAGGVSGVVVGDKITIALEIEAILAANES